jgi:hypothetical protein
VGIAKSPESSFIYQRQKKDINQLHKELKNGSGSKRMRKTVMKNNGESLVLLES